MRVMGLLFHMWRRKVFKYMGDGCKGFITIDEDTTFFFEL